MTVGRATWPRPTSAAAPRPRRRSATATLYVEQLLAARPPRRGADRRRRDRRRRHLWERECSLQRRHQKLIEIAPAPACRRRCARRLLRRGGDAWREAAHYRSLGTIEFLVDARGGATALRLHRGQPAPAGRAHGHRGGDRPRPRAQRSSQLAAGATPGRPRPGPGRRAGAARHRHPGAGQHGDHDRRRHGAARPAACSTRLRAAVRARASASTPSATPATAPAPRFDSLLAKVIVHAPPAAWPAPRAKARRALCGVPDRGRADQRRLPAGPAGAPGVGRRRGPHPLRRGAPAPSWPPPAGTAPLLRAGRARAAPSAPAPRSTRSIRWPCWRYGKTEPRPPTAAAADEPSRRPGGHAPLRAPLQGTVVSIAVARRRRGARRPAAGRHGSHEDGARGRRRRRRRRARRSPSRPGDTVFEGHPAGLHRGGRRRRRRRRRRGGGRPRRHPPRPGRGARAPRA